MIAVAALRCCSRPARRLAIPYAFKLIIDNGFARRRRRRDIARWFHYLLLLVGVMAVATAFRFYFVSWIGERTVADIRARGAPQPAAPAPRFFEENRPSEIASRITVDTTIIEQVVGTTVSVALRNLVLASACAVILFALAPRLAACCCSAFAGGPADRLPRPAGARDSRA